MRKVYFAFAFITLLSFNLFERADAADPTAPEIAALRAEIDTLKQHYNAEIAGLEVRLKRAEAGLEDRTAAPLAQPVPSPIVATAAPVVISNPASSASALNPATSLVLIGNYAALSRNPAQFGIPGFALPGSAGPGVRGFSLGESELTLSANIDDKFYGSLTTSLSVEHGNTSIALEEAYFQTLALPYSLTLKGGRFFSRIGYLNEQHPHADDFVDRPLAYQVFLNNTLGDDGLQLRWLAPLDQFLEFGAEAYRGDSFPANGARGHGLGTYTAFVHLGDDLTDEWSYRLGGSYVHAEAAGRTTGNLPDVFDGTSELAIADMIFKWAPNGNPAQRNLKLQGEYLRRWESGQFNGGQYTGSQDGFYLQAVYQFRPRWRIGLRYDGLFADNTGSGIVGTPLDALGHDPNRGSVLFEFDNSEFSRLRLQYSVDNSAHETDHQLYLNYIYSLGAHGAHQF